MLPVTGFELRVSGVRSNHSTNRVATTAPKLSSLFDILRKPGHLIVIQLPLCRCKFLLSLGNRLSFCEEISILIIPIHSISMYLRT